MTDADDELVKEIGAAVAALNTALRKARDARLDVDLTYDSMHEIGRWGSLRIYRAKVSRQEFEVVARP